MCTMRVRRQQRTAGRQFDKIITAQDVKAYKPAPNHFEALDGALKELGSSP